VKNIILKTISAKKRESFAISLFNSLGYGETSIKKEVEFFLNSLGNIKDNPFVVLDIGANIGTYSKEMLNRNDKALVHSFEPSKYAGEIFKENLKKHINNKRCFFYNYGIGKENSNEILFAPDHGSAAASLYNRQGNNMVREKIIVRSLSQATRSIEGPIVGMKIDTEGHEYTIFLSAKKLLKSKDFKVVQFEFGEFSLENQESFKLYYDFLKNLGFKLYRISKYGMTEITEYRKMLEIHWNTNYLAVKSAIQDSD
jgi:FkbM family methyltransferase